ACLIYETASSVMRGYVGIKISHINGFGVRYRPHGYSFRRLEPAGGAGCATGRTQCHPRGGAPESVPVGHERRAGTIAYAVQRPPVVAHLGRHVADLERRGTGGAGEAG